MAVRKHNDFLDLGFSEGEEDLSSSSEVAADSRVAGLAIHRSKRQKLTVEQSESEEETENDAQDDDVPSTSSPQVATKPSRQPAASTTTPAEKISTSPPTESPETQKPLTTSSATATGKKPAHKPGVIYLSRIPPFMRPSTVRTLLSTHGPITRLFLTPEAPSTYLSRRKAGGNKKRSFIDGWLEFAKKRDAKACVDAINGRIVGGKKGGWYRDDVWNAKYLRGFGWGDLMAGVRAEEREREERIRVGVGREGRERAEFLRNLERGRVEETRRVKRERKAEREGGGKEAEGKEKEKGNRFERRFRQNEVKTREETGTEQSDETRRILSKIF